MKKHNVLFISVLLFLSCTSIFAKKQDKKIPPYVMESFETNKINKQLGYQLIGTGDKIVFVFDAKSYKIDFPKKVFVEGSFNGWAKGNNKDWQLEKISNNIWTLECSSVDVMVPGNSGFPEFKFYVIADVEYVERIIEVDSVRKREERIEPAAISRIPGFQMATNNLILFPGDDPNVVIENVKVANTLKKLKDFDLSNPEDIATISNVRIVPGTTKLFRGYHPYKLSRSQFNTEKTRIELVNKAIEDNGIKSIITLSGNEQVISGKEEISSYIQNINYANNHLFIDSSYNTVYYKSTSSDFGKQIAQIITFINTHPSPYYIHCRLGTDRTGVTSAVLAALCGASWNDICIDYQKTNDMGIKEFRDYRLLQYSFENMLGKSMNEVENLQEELGNYFVERNFVSKDDLDTLVTKLK